MKLTKVKPGCPMTVSRIEGTDKIRSFLLSLGCFEGQQITLVSVLAGNYVINVRDSRFAIDRGMAGAIELAV